MGDFTITAIHGQRDWENPKGGTIRYFDLELEGAGRASLGQRSDKPDPKVGDTLLGYSIEETDKGKKIKKEYVAGGGGGKSPEQQKAIVRQHSQEMALRWMAIQVTRGKVPDEFGYDQLKPIVDWFAEDAG